MELINVLSQEKSLYLLQHKDNPVKWQTWGDDAFKMARELDRPVFLSIGYSSCHWCHVMEAESFVNDKTAKILNEKFIPIKVDREEFPDIDKRYQFYLQTINQQGGWPLSIFLLPDGTPFYGGTYFPGESKYSLPAFSEVLEKIYEMYMNDREHVKETADNYRNFLMDFKQTKFSLDELDETPLSAFDNEFFRIMDMEKGGFGAGARFPQVPSLLYLLERYDNERIASFLKKTADMMCCRGIFDHINGGFFRYTIDKEWHTPHFEKMLYDQALNSIFLIRMFMATDNPLYLHVARKTIDFTLDNFNTDFGLLSSMDADSPDENGKMSEGNYYKILQKDLKALDEGERENFMAHVYPQHGVAQFASADYETYLKIEPLFEKIAESMDERMPPAKDNKVILAWNALFCRAVLELFEASGEEFYLERAKALLGKIEYFHVDGTSLFRVNYEGETHRHVTLEDYACLANLHTAFFEITNEKDFLVRASAIMERAVNDFTDGGLLYLDREHRTLETFDDSMPAPSGMIVADLAVYGGYMGVEISPDQLNFTADRIMKYPTAHATALKGLRVD
ncbi:thioredoxin domain-containing protein [Limisalsivibrio acetivorans]|uniref:thioredoxin domain-containing protein n=1 Tax=Limisalsivibrio acetivorans TaxID=1304888 RepID=UPI0003B45340|nr:DUF255 domain-containing protein [Limisalsivibrio acetivorans]